MPEYLSPGVYVEEVDAGPVPIEGVSTSTCGMVGFTLRGPSEGKPLLVTSYTEFVRVFGGAMADPPDPILNRWGDSTNVEGGSFWQFPLSVKGFFDNGGQRLYVKRVFSANAAAASGSLGQGLVAEIVRDSPDGKALDLSHLFGIQNNSSITVYIDGQPQAASTVNWYDRQANRVFLSTALGLAVKGGRDFVVIKARSKANAGVVAPNDVTLTFDAQQIGAWGNGLQVRLRPMSGTVLKLPGDTTASLDPTTVVSTTLPPPTIVIALDDVTGFVAPGGITIGTTGYQLTNVDAVHKQLTVQVVGASQADPKFAAGTTVTAGATSHKITSEVSFTAGTWKITVADASHYVAGDHLLIGGAEYVINAPAGNDLTVDTTKTSKASPLGVSFPAGTPVKRARKVPFVGATLKVAGADQLYVNALVEFDNGLLKDTAVVTAINGNTVTFSAAPANSYTEGDMLRVVEARLTSSFGSESETVSDLPLTNSGQDLADAVNAKSTLVTVTPGPNFKATPALDNFPTIADGVPFNNDWLLLDGGDDDLGGLTVDDFVGFDGGSGKRTGIQALEDVDEIAICLVPGMWSETVQSALITHCETLRYRFGILDPPDGLSIQGVQSFRGPYDTRFAALYYPWIRIHDPIANGPADIAPAGHVAGIYARVDVNRGVYKAPANEVIQGINLVDGLAQDVNKREQDVLNPIGINALRFFTDRGQRVWGARTLSSDAQWKYVNVKRLFIFIEHSLDKGTQWVVFEPNDENTWARVRQSITNFLTTIWHEGGLQGAKASDAFFVKVDLTTMSQDDIDNGRMIIIVGIAPVKPAEFVIIRIQQKTLDQQAP